jgi:major intracellular serine protease
MRVFNIIDEATSNRKNIGLDLVGVKNFWNKGIYGEGTVIAIADTGIDIKHESLFDKVIGGRNFTKDYDHDPNNFNDENGHGSHIAGIIGANNKKFLIGMAPKSSLLILKVLTNQGIGDVNNLIQSIYYAITWRGENGEKVDILTMSLGSKLDNPILHEAILAAVSHGISVVVASGNDGDGMDSEEFRYPGAYNEVIEVGSVNAQKAPSRFSNNNKEIDLVAPGEEIFSTYKNNTYKTLSGTSMAAPFVAGSLALLREESKILFQRNLSESEIFAQLIKSTNRNHHPLIEGNGILDLSKSFQ